MCWPWWNSHAFIRRATFFENGFRIIVLHLAGRAALRSRRLSEAAPADPQLGPNRLLHPRITEFPLFSAGSFESVFHDPKAAGRLLAGSAMG